MRKENFPQEIPSLYMTIYEECINKIFVEERMHKKLISRPKSHRETLQQTEFDEFHDSSLHARLTKSARKLRNLKF